MRVQTRQNNQPHFQAGSTINDAGKCFSLVQRLKLKRTARRIGNKSDRIFIGTRTDKIGESSKSSSAIVLSLIDNKAVDMRFNNAEFGNIADYLQTFSNKEHNFAKIKPQHTEYIIQDMKEKIKEFCNYKKTSHKPSLFKMLKNIFTPKQTTPHIIKKNTKNSSSNLKKERFAPLDLNFSNLFNHTPEKSIYSE